MKEATPNDPRMGTIQNAVFVELSTNPDCHIVADIIQEALKRDDIEFAYKVALDSLKPRKSLFKIIMESIHGKHA